MINLNKDFENYLKNLNINLAEYEKLGSFFLALGYSTYILAANLAIQKGIEEDNYNLESPEGTLVFAQYFVLLGYIILYIVSSKRILEEILSQNYYYNSIYLVPFLKVNQSYLISALANFYRLEGFYEIYLLTLYEEQEDKEDYEDE